MAFTTPITYKRTEKGTQVSVSLFHFCRFFEKIGVELLV